MSSNSALLPSVHSFYSIGISLRSVFSIFIAIVPAISSIFITFVFMNAISIAKFVVAIFMIQLFFHSVILVATLMNSLYNQTFWTKSTTVYKLLNVSPSAVCPTFPTPYKTFLITLFYQSRSYCPALTADTFFATT
jgi:hypothetical protein